jgi:pyocin large subunit-like protein
MGFASAEEYQAAASAVITNPDSLFKTEADDGDGVYYLEETNEFVILSTDGYIRTYFLPSSGRAYFDRQ